MSISGRALAVEQLVGFFTYMYDVMRIGDKGDPKYPRDGVADMPPHAAPRALHVEIQYPSLRPAPRAPISNTIRSPLKSQCRPRRTDSIPIPAEDI